MNQNNIKGIVEDLIQTFLYAGEVSLKLRDQGLLKEMKSDNTPVSNGDLEVNKILINKIKGGGMKTTLMNVNKTFEQNVYKNTNSESILTFLSIHAKLQPLKKAFIELDNNLDEKNTINF